MVEKNSPLPDLELLPESAVHILVLDLVLGRRTDYTEEPLTRFDMTMREKEARSFLAALCDETPSQVSLHPPDELVVSGYTFVFRGSQVEIFQPGQQAAFATTPVNHIRAEAASWRDPGSKHVESGQALILHIDGEIAPIPTPGRTITVGGMSYAEWRDATPEVPRPSLGSGAQLMALSRRLRLDNELIRPVWARDTNSMLILEIDGEPEQFERDMERVGGAIVEADALDVLVAQDAAQRERLWEARRQLSYTTRKMARHKISEDVVVPRTRMAELIRDVGEISERHEVQMVNYGHAGDGNLHGG